ncbi:MAG: helix-turn-helix transcriptional regulator, partial [Bullifex sp.]
ENLSREITLSDLSAVSFYSPWHAHRLFREYTGFSVGKYIRSLRLSEAAVRLRDEDVSVTEVSLESGFGSVDGFQRAFRNEFSVNPGTYSRHPIPIPLFIPYGVSYRRSKENEVMKECRNVFVSLVEKEERKVIIRRGRKADEYFSYCAEVGCDVWGILKSMDSEPVCLYLPAKYIKPGTSSYVQGVEKPLDYDGPVPEGFDVITLPKTSYLMFQGEPFAEEDYEEAIIAVKQSMDKYDPSILGYKFTDAEPRIQLEPVGKRGYIELKAVEKL